MASGSSAPVSGAIGTMRRRGPVPSMSQREVQAYLVTREMLRRLRRRSWIAEQPPAFQTRPFQGD